MKLTQRLFGTSKAVDAVIATGDKLFYTDQEKAEYRIKFLEAVQPFKVVQRIMVGLIMGVWALICLMIMVGIVAHEFTEGRFDIVTPLMELIKSEVIWIPVSGAVGLYLGGGLLESKARGNVVGKKE